MKAHHQNTYKRKEDKKCSREFIFRKSLFMGIVHNILNFHRWHRALNALKAMHTMKKLTFPDIVPGIKIIN